MMLRRDFFKRMAFAAVASGVLGRFTLPRAEPVDVLGDDQGHVMLRASLTDDGWIGHEGTIVRVKDGRVCLSHESFGHQSVPVSIAGGFPRDGQSVAMWAKPIPATRPMAVGIRKMVAAPGTRSLEEMRALARS